MIVEYISIKDFDKSPISTNFLYRANKHPAKHWDLSNFSIICVYCLKLDLAICRPDIHL